MDVVRVDALVTRRGRPVGDLAAKDFELLDDGVPQQVEFVSAGTVPVNLVLVLDSSESVAGERLTSLIAASRAVVGALRPIDRAAVLTFSQEITERVPLTGDREQLLAGLNGLSGAGNTSLYDAVYAGLLLGTRDESRTLVLVFSDGHDTSSWLESSAVVDAAARSEAIVYAVVPQAVQATRAENFMRHPYGHFQLGQMKPRSKASQFLDQITASTGGRLLTTGAGDLSQPFVDVLREFQNRYILAYVPTGVSDRGWHDITVRARRSGVEVLSRRGYRR